MGKNIVNTIDGKIKVNNVLISVSDKNGLDSFVENLVSINPDIKIFSTGGTYNKIKGILKEKAEKNLIAVSDYTGQPETQGGLVKTLDFKIYLGLLTETYNDSHQEDLKRTDAVAIDMIVVNLYPFKETIAKDDATFEKARGNIDIGGPCMIRASAKNCIRVASVVSPEDYDQITAELKNNNGYMDFKMRYELASKAFRHTYEYDQSICRYFESTEFRKQVASCYQEN